MRKSRGSTEEQEAYTDALLQQIFAAVEAAADDRRASDQLDLLLRNAQEEASMNPFVSCSLDWAAAYSFAAAGAGRGYVLTLEGNEGDGLNFESVRRRFGYRSKPYTQLREFGVPKRLSLTNERFVLRAVEWIEKGDAPQVVWENKLQERAPTTSRSIGENFRCCTATCAEARFT